MSVSSFIIGIQGNTFESNFDSTRIEKWKLKLIKIFQSTSDHKKLMECVFKYIEYIINYSCSLNNRKEQIAICRKYLVEVVEEMISTEYQNAFIQELCQKIFDIIMEEDANSWCIKKELLNVFTQCARKVDKHIRQKTISHLPRIYLFKLFDSISTFSDFDLQVLLIETLFCMYGKENIMSKLKDLIPESEELSENFASINLDTFYENVRKFLNILNDISKKIFSIKCCLVKLGNFTCVQNIDELDGIWVNFNLTDKAVSWYCCKSTFDAGDDDDVDPVNSILLFGSDIRTVMVDSSSDRTGVVVTFKLKDSCICTCEKLQHYIDKCDSFNLFLKDSVETRKLISEILPQLFRKKFLREGNDQTKVSKHIKGDYKPLHISKSKSVNNISNSSNWLYQSATTSPSSKNDIVLVPDTSRSHSESEDFLATKSQDQYQTPPNEMEDDIISLYSSLSNELLSIHDDMERIQILSGRCSKSNVNVVPSIRSHCKGVSRSSRPTTNRMEDIVEENDNQFQTASEKVSEPIKSHSVEVFRTADEMVSSQGSAFKASRVIKVLNSVVSPSDKQENLKGGSNKQDLERDKTLYSQTGIKVSQNTWEDNGFDQRIMKNGESCGKEDPKSSQVGTEKTPKSSEENAQVQTKISKYSKVVNTIRMAQAEKSNRRNCDSQFSSDDDLPLSVLAKPLLLKTIEKKVHIKQDIGVHLTKKNEDNAVSSKSLRLEEKTGKINRTDEIVKNLPAEGFQKALVEDEESKKQTPTAEATDGVVAQEFAVDTITLIKDTKKPCQIPDKNQQSRSKKKHQLAGSIKEMNSSKLTEDRPDGFESTEREETDQSSAEAEYVRSKMKTQPAETVAKICVFGIPDKKTDQTSGKTRSQKSRRNTQPTETNEEMVSPKANMQPIETIEEIDSPKLIEDRVVGLESTEKEITEQIPRKSQYMRSKMKTQPTEIVTKMCVFGSQEKKTDQISGKTRSQKLKKNTQPTETNEEMDSPKAANKDAGVFESTDNEKTGQIPVKSRYQKSKKNIVPARTIEEMDFPKLIEEKTEREKTEQIPAKSQYMRSKTNIQPIEKIEEIDSPKLIEDRAVGLENIEKENTVQIPAKSQYIRSEKNTQPTGTIEEIDSPKLIQDRAVGLESTEKEMTEQIPTKSQSMRSKMKTQPAKTVAKMCVFGSQEKKTDQISGKTWSQKSKKNIQRTETNAKMDSPKATNKDAGVFESTANEKTGQIPVKNRYQKSKKNIVPAIRIIGEMDFPKLIEENTDREKTEQIPAKSQYMRSKTNIQPIETIEEIDSPKLIEDRAVGLENTEKEMTEQIPAKSQSMRSKMNIQPTETIEKMDSPKLIEDRAVGLESTEKEMTVQIPAKSQYMRSKKNTQPTGTIEEIDSPKLANKSASLSESIDKGKTNQIPDESRYQKSKKKPFDIKQLKNIVIPLIPFKSSDKPITKGLTRMKLIADKRSAEDLEGCQCSKFKEEETLSKENHCPNIPQTHDKSCQNKPKIIRKRQMKRRLDETVTNIKTRVVIEIEKTSIQDTDVPKESEGVHKGPSITDGLSQCIEENPTPNELVLETDSLDDIFQRLTQPIENILTETPVPRSPSQKSGRGRPIPNDENSILRDEEDAVEGKDVPSEGAMRKYESQEISSLCQISVPEALRSRKLAPEKDTVFNEMLEEYKNEIQKRVQFKKDKVMIGMTDKSTNLKRTRAVEKEENVDAIQKFIEASFDRSNKDSNQTLSTTISGKRKLRKLYDPGDLSFIDILEKRSVAVPAINQNEAVEVNNVTDKQDTTVMDEQVNKATNSALKKQKVARAEVKSIAERIKPIKSKTSLEKEVDKSRKHSKVKPSKPSGKHNVSEEKRARLKSCFSDMLKSFHQEMGMTSVVEYVRKPKSRRQEKSVSKIEKRKTNYRRFSMNRVMRTDKHDLSDSSASSADMRVPKHIVKPLASTPPAPASLPEEIPVVPIEPRTKKIHIISDVLLEPAPMPKKIQRLDGHTNEHFESGLANSITEDVVPIPRDNCGLVSHPAPNWKGTALVNGEFKSIESKDYIGKYVIIFFYPLDFGRCDIHEPSDVVALSKRVDAFRKLNCEVVVCSVDHHWTHLEWATRLEENIDIPILADPTHTISQAFGVYMSDTGYTYRSLFLIKSDGIIAWNETIGVQYEISIERLLAVLQYVLSRDI